MAALVCALALAGCGSLGPLPVATKTASPRATTTPKPALAWRTVALPTELTPSTTGIAISPVNGSDAWFCAPAVGTKGYEVWRTNDAGMTWMKASYLTPAMSQPFTSCSLTADQSTANALAVNFTWGAANSPVDGTTGSYSYYSTDDGATWNSLGQNRWITQVATIGATTYAELLDTSQGSKRYLVVSADHLATWRGVNEPTQNTQQDFQFWAASTSGELLWADMNAGGAFFSDDGGASWQPVSPPVKGQSLQVTLALWRPGQATGQQANDWLICGYAQAATAQASTQNLCTSDQGKTWTTSPTLNTTWECGHCAQGGGPSTGVNPCLATAIASDGALYAVCGNDPQDSGTPQPTSWALTRLAPGDGAWTTVGEAPCQSVTMTQTGQAWCVNPVSASVFTLAQLP
jgi:hypothetical protein